MMAATRGPASLLPTCLAGRRKIVSTAFPKTRIASTAIGLHPKPGGPYGKYLRYAIHAQARAPRTPYQTDHITRFGNYTVNFSRTPEPLPLNLRESEGH